VTQGDPYLYRGLAVLQNKLGITDAAVLGYRERELFLQRATEPIPAGQFDLRHLRAIHKHLFQDVYSWAGKIRTVRPHSALLFEATWRASWTYDRLG